jgi:DNA-binding PadR family transcriptional regulator
MAGAPLTPVVFHVLLALSDGPLHGYAIMRAVDETAGGVIATGPGMVYGTLRRLETAGLVRETAARDDRRRRFALTAAGRRALATEAARLTHLVRLVRAHGLTPEKS